MQEIATPSGSGIPKSAPYGRQRALQELGAAMDAVDDHVGDLHLWLFELHLDRCRQEVVPRECDDCPLLNVCSIERECSKYLRDLTDSRLLHLWFTISDDDANGTVGETIATVLIAPGLPCPTAAVSWIVPGGSDTRCSAHIALT